MNPGADSGFPSFQWQRRGPAVFSPCWRGGFVHQASSGNARMRSRLRTKRFSLMGACLRVCLPGIHSKLKKFGALLADKAFDVQWLMAPLQTQGVTIVILQRPNRRQLQGCDLSGFGCDSILVTFSGPWRSKWWNNDNRSKFCFWCRRGILPHGGWGVLEALSILTAQFSDWMLG